jgi:hypothetical protein
MTARRTTTRQTGHSTKMPAIHKQNHALTPYAEHLWLLAKNRSPSPSLVPAQRIPQIPLKHYAK